MFKRLSIIVQQGTGRHNLQHRCHNLRTQVASVPQQCNVELCIMSVCRVVKCDKKRKHRSAGPLLHGGPSSAADDPSVSKFVLQSWRRPLLDTIKTLC